MCHAVLAVFVPDLKCSRLSAFQIWNREHAIDNELLSALSEARMCFATLLRHLICIINVSTEFEYIYFDFRFWDLKFILVQFWQFLLNYILCQKKVRYKGSSTPHLLF